MLKIEKKMTTIKLNNKNQTEINFSYDNGLPYKKAIRPSIEYGNWTNNEDIMVIKVFLSQQDISFFSDKNNIECLKLNKIKEEIWFDLKDVYCMLFIILLSERVSQQLDFYHG